MIRLIEESSLEELTDVFQALAKKVHGHRVKGDGRVPLQVFPSTMTLGGTIPVIELIIEVRDTPEASRAFALKLRDHDADHWRGYWHVPGTVSRVTDTWESVFSRLSAEVRGTKKLVNRRNLTFAGIATHFQEERGATEWSICYMLSIPHSEFLELGDKWILYRPGEKNHRIVPYHRALLSEIEKSGIPFELNLTKPPRATASQARRRGHPRRSGK